MSSTLQFNLIGEELPIPVPDTGLVTGSSIGSSLSLIITISTLAAIVTGVAVYFALRAHKRNVKILANSDNFKIHNNRIFPIALISLLALTAGFVGVSNFAEPNETSALESEGIEKLAIESAGELVEDVQLTKDGAFAIASDTVKVTDSTEHGYSLFVSAENDNNLYLDENNYLVPTASASLDANSWGFTTEENPTLASNWSAVGTENHEQFVKTTTSATEAGDETTIYYGVHADTSMEPGAYKGTITYTAVPNYVFTAIDDEHSDIVVQRTNSLVPGAALGTINPSEPLYIGDQIRASVTVPIGYHIDTFTINDKEAVSPTAITVGESLNFRATSAIDQHVVHYNATENGGTFAAAAGYSNAATVNYFDAIDLDAAHRHGEKSGWEFVGWNTNKDATTALTSLDMAGDDVTLYAIYKKDLALNFYQIEAIGGVKNNQITRTIYNKATSATYDAPIVNVATDCPTVGTCTAGNWSASTDSPTGVIDSGAKNQTISINNNGSSYYAVNNYDVTVSYDGNGADSGSIADVKKTANLVATAADRTVIAANFQLADYGSFSKTGYVATKWAINSAEGTQYDKGVVIPASVNTTFYAIWTPNEHTLSLTSDEHSSIVVKRGDTPLVDQDTIYYDEELTVECTPSTGYEISVCDIQNSGEAVTESELIVKGDVSISSEATAKSYTVTLDHGTDGYGGTESVTATFDSAMPADDLSSPTRQGYTFTGYNTKSDGTGTSYYNAYMESAHDWDIAEDTTLYAQYVNTAPWTGYRNAETFVSDFTSDSATLNAMLLTDINTNLTTASSSTLNLALNGHKIQGDGTGSVIINNATLGIYDATNEADDTLGGNENLAQFNESGTTYKFRVEDSGLWVLDDSGDRAITGGIITGGNASAETKNNKNGYGGGIYNLGNIAFYNGNIVGNRSLEGGGVLVGGYNSVEMYGGAIIGNIAGNGAGVSTFNVFTLKGGTVAYNVAEHDGGGIMDWGSYTTISGGTIEYNRASRWGGGIFLYLKAQTVLEGGDIANNTTGEAGGGIYAMSSSIQLKATNYITIQNNKLTDESSNNLYLADNAIIKLDSLRPVTGLIGISVPRTATIPVKITDSLPTDGDYSHFISDDSAYQIGDNGTSNLYIIEK